VSGDAATMGRPLSGVLGTYAALAAAEFRRYATYRQALIAAMFTNSVFGFLRCFVLLAVAAGIGSHPAGAGGHPAGAGGHAGAGTAAGYPPERLATYVWIGQGLLGTINIWSPPELAERIRTGDVVADLLRPVDPVRQYLAADLGRAGFAAITRLIGPVLVGALAFTLYTPVHPATYPLFAVSVLLATVVCFACRYLVNATTYWLLDSRGAQIGWVAVSATLSGMAFPLAFLPRALTVALYATPFPALIQIPADVLVERHPLPVTGAMVAGQATWAVVMLALARTVQRRAERRLVIQGG
jgi:viologen exporter family transport system permease protein